MNQAAAPQPLYRHIKAHILQRILTGDLEPGARVPSENQLVGDFGVSRMTANRALRELNQEGVVTRLAGVGTFVSKTPRRSSLLEIRNIAEEIVARGHRHTARIEQWHTIQANPALAEEFETHNGAPLFHLILVHMENATPVQLEDRYVNPELVPKFLDQDFSVTTPSAYLAATVRADELEHMVEAIIPTAQQRQLLDIPSGEPCLQLQRRSWCDAKVVTFARLTWPASRYALHSRYALSATTQLQSPTGQLP